MLFGLVAWSAACTFETETPTEEVDTLGGTGGFIKPDVTKTDTGGDEDAGSAAADAGNTDTGSTTNTDTGGTTTTDAGSTSTDTGSTATDTGSSTGTDAGGGTTDAGSTDDAGSQDAGTADAGAPDAGFSGCKAADPKSCDDGKPCTQDVCDEPTGECAHIPLPSGSPCDAGFLCSASVCKTNVGCTPSGEKKKCDDGQPCTVDDCVEGKGCTSKVGGNAPCDDGNPCTKYDHCKTGKCAGTFDNCDDGWPCTADTCDKKKGCQHKVQLSGPCDDGNACTKGTECVFGDCKGPKLPCNDGNSCTTDICDAKKGCTYKKLDQIPCDDGSACTVNTECAAGSCKGAKRDCGDGKSCTADSCDPKTGCNNELQKDGAACLLGGTCQKGLCSSMLNCGNGKIDKGEKCDDGNKNPCDNCNNTCSGSGAGTKVSGTATIGKGGQYRKISEAIQALKTCNVSGPTTFIVLPGKYTESAGFPMPNIGSASPKSPITFKADPTGTVELIGRTGKTSYHGVIRFDSGAHDITVDGFTISGAQSANWPAYSRSGVVTWQNGNPQRNITARNLKIVNFGQSAWMQGTSSSTSYQGLFYIPSFSKPLENIRIENNTMTGNYKSYKTSTSGGIFIDYGRFKGLRVTGNQFSTSDLYAFFNIYRGYQFDNVVLANNFIIQQYGYALHVYYAYGFNNDMYIAFNTLVMQGSAYYAARFYRFNYNGGAKGKVVWRNNIIASMSGTKNLVSLYPSTSIWANPGNNCLFNINGPGNMGSKITGNPQFKSLAYPYDLHINASSPCANKGSLDIPGVTHDIDGQLRMNPPDIGADEHYPDKK